MDRKKILVTLVSLAMLLSMVPMTVAADTSGTSSVTGNPTAYIAITVVGDISDWELTPDSTNLNATGANLTVTANIIGWTVHVKDALDNSKPAGSVGMMAEYNTTTPEYVSDGDVLVNNMTVEGLDVTGTTGDLITLGPTDMQIEIGTDEANARPMDIKIRQTVTKYDPRLLEADHVYRMIVTFTGAIA